MLTNTGHFNAIEKTVYTNYTVEYLVPDIHIVGDGPEWIRVYIKFKGMTVDEVEYDTDLLTYAGEWYLKGLITKTLQDIYNELRGGENKCA